MRALVFSLAVLVLSSSNALAEKSCAELFASIPSSAVASVNHHLEVPTVAWLKFGGEYGNGVASAYQVELPGLSLKNPITRVLCVRLEQDRYDSPGLSYDLKVPLGDLKLTGFSESKGPMTGQAFFRCLDIDRCAIRITESN